MRLQRARRGLPSRPPPTSENAINETIFGKVQGQHHRQNVAAQQRGRSTTAQETGVPRDTLYTWRLKHRKSQGEPSVSPVTASAGLSSEEKFAVVLESATLNEVELSEYCRGKGLYPEQIQAWRAACLQANAVAIPKVDQAQIRAQAKQLKALEAELRRKDKALAETAALLVLQKKSRQSGGSARTKNRAMGASASDSLY